MDSLRAFTFLPAIPAAPDGEDGDVRATPRPRQGTTGERSHPPAPGSSCASDQCDSHV